MGRGAGHNELNVHVKPKDRLESLLKSPRYRSETILQMKSLRTDRVMWLESSKADRLQPVDVEVVGGSAIWPLHSRAGRLLIRP